jgi:hypothetical protein
MDATSSFLTGLRCQSIPLIHINRSQDRRVSAQEDWKQKYRELALEVERTNQQGLKTEQALRQLVMQLGIALAGEDAELDGAMAVLRAHLQNGGTDSDKLFALTFPLEQLLQRYGQDRNGAVRQATQALEKWLKLLEIDSGQKARPALYWALTPGLHNHRSYPLYQRSSSSPVLIALKVLSAINRE